MSWVKQVIQEFGHQIGIPNLDFGDEESVILDVADRSSIGIVRVKNNINPEIIVFRTMPVNRLSYLHLRESLRASNFRTSGTWPLQAACDRQDLIVAIRIPERAFLMSSLNKALDDLYKICEKIGAI